MALSDEVTSRYPDSRLIQLTNAGDESADSVDTTMLGKAATDTEAKFVQLVGVEYDNSVATHVETAVLGVIAYLYRYGESPGTAAERAMEQFKESCEELAKVTARNRIKPRTTSVLTVSDEQEGGETVRPDTDREHYNKLVPETPTQSSKLGRTT